ncbi:MAG: DUF1573 domain-containing protein [Muribaculaceae bacterium]|nr:DUF1573 domain-containing protein [Muribaculaceae bacterium]
MSVKINKILTGIVISVLSLSFVACEKKLGPVSVEIIDQVRHYYPVIQGEMMGITYEIENTSENTLFIREIQTTCGCLVPHDDLPIVILPKRKGFIHLGFNTIKNTGYVKHYVWCYGNFADSAWRELRFDTNVVPNADYTRDYEQLWHEQTTKTGSMRDFVDGKTSEKGYYTDEGIDPRDQTNEKIQNFIDDLLSF